MRRMIFRVLCCTVLFFYSCHSTCPDCTSYGVKYEPSETTFANKYLKGYTLSSLFVHDASECFLSCIYGDCRCASMNYKTTPEANGTHLCELNYETKNSGNSSNVISMSGFFLMDVMTYTQAGDDCSSCGTGCCNPNPCLNNGKCVETCEDARRFKCNCTFLYTGRFCQENKAVTCKKLLDKGFTVSGVYSINPDNQGEFDVWCDMETSGGGWEVCQRRKDGSEDFYRKWNDYKNGFGNLTGEFWLGNDKLHRLTEARDVILRFDLEDFNNTKAYAEYGSFKIAGEQDYYRMTLSGYNGTAGDSMARHNNMHFSTHDKDNDEWDNNCAETFEGAWWYTGCHDVNINGHYYSGGFYYVSANTGIRWRGFRDPNYSLKFTEMKLKSKQ